MSNSFVQLPPDNIGKKVFAIEHTVGTDEVQVQGVHISDPINPENIQYVDNKGAAYTRYTEGVPVFDSANRMKIVESKIIGVYEHTNGDYNDLFWVQEENGATSTYDVTTSSVLMTTTTASNSLVRRTTNRYHYYQPSCPIIAHFQVSCGDIGTANNIRNWGYFDANDGWYFSLDGTTLYVVQRSSVTGSVQELKIAQSNWNRDKLDGTGESEFDLDLTKVNHYWIDIDYPCGAIRFGVFSNNSERVVCHTIENVNNNTYPICRTASLPIRATNKNVGIVSTPAILRVIQGSVAAQGTPDYSFWRTGGISSGSLTCTDLSKAILSIRPKYVLDNGKNNHINIFPELFYIYASHPVKIDIITFVDNGSTILTNDTWTLTGGSLDGDKTATDIDDESPNYTLFLTLFANSGVTEFELSKYFELNDEGILVYADDLSRLYMSFVATPLTENSTTVNMSLTCRELW